MKKKSAGVKERKCLQQETLQRMKMNVNVISIILKEEWVHAMSSILGGAGFFGFSGFGVGVGEEDMINGFPDGSYG